jgi:hypothetical protein
MNQPTAIIIAGGLIAKRSASPQSDLHRINRGRGGMALLHRHMRCSASV